MIKIGDKAGRWTVISRIEPTIKNPKWHCRCDCGTEKGVLQFALLSGGSMSCGCIRTEKNTKHGQCPKNGRTPEYGAWSSILDRCKNPKAKQYPNYGGRGILVCERWLDFNIFSLDMGKRPTSSHSIDRIDNSKGYEPDNCRWASKKEQARNRRSNKYLEYRGETRIMAEWAEIIGLPYKVLKDRINRGMEINDAFSKPYKPRIGKK